ncbi:MAG: hypothetical protein JW807_01540 [Spirochaetes bacterium]|nr:hypothetical protein [Spirochaetota bacterium]
MSARNLSKVMSLVIVGVFAFSLSFAQEKASDDGITKMPDGSYRSKDHDESNRPDDDYLSKFAARDYVEKFMKRNIEEIYLLNVLIKNNPGKGWDGKYEELYKGYMAAMSQYYKRNLIYARDKLEKNQVAIRELFKIVIEDYKKQCDELLNECAGKVMLLHMDVSSRIDPDRYDQLWLNSLRLRVAYGQLDDAQRAEIEKYYSGAIYHLRVSRAYGVAILEDLAKDENERKAVTDKYRVMKADNRNRIFKQESK